MVVGDNTVSGRVRIQCVEDPGGDTRVASEMSPLESERLVLTRTKGSDLLASTLLNMLLNNY